ncbi:hypothetical protein AGMMS50293_08390 [Spirochaetia bacterium]|nr:hypothetical protein AGMMS50293_08390 [Spirochaetia bacterium]
MEDPWSPLEPLPSILIILVLILLSSLFSLFDAALAASRKPKLQKEAAQSQKMKRLLEAAENPHVWLATVRVWINILRIAAAFLAGFIVTRFFNTPGQAAAAAGFAAALIITVSSLAAAAILLGDIIPRLIVRAAPESIASALLPVIGVFALPLKPFSFLTLPHPGAGLRLEGRSSGITEDELRFALMEGEKSGIVESKERTMVEGVFYLGDRPVGAFMSHRSEIQWLDVNAAPRDIRSKALEYRSQRCFPVADGTLDEIIGAAYLEDIILDQAEESPKGLRSIMKRAQFVPETMPAIKVFESFKRGEANFLFVMDEYGGFAGIISIRDLVEEIVGELTATRQEEEPLIKQEDGTWLADGSANIDDAAKILALPGLAAAPADYHTLAGFVLSLAGELPHTGDSFTYQGFRFKVVDMDGNRIDKLLISME